MQTYRCHCMGTTHWVGLFIADLPPLLMHLYYFVICNQTLVKCHSVIQRCTKLKSVTNKTLINKNEFMILQKFGAQSNVIKQLYSITQVNNADTTALGPAKS